MVEHVSSGAAAAACDACATHMKQVAYLSMVAAVASTARRLELCALVRCGSWILCETATDAPELCGMCDNCAAQKAAQRGDVRSEPKFKKGHQPIPSFQTLLSTDALSLACPTGFATASGL